jgi:hypothetical protein
VEGGRGGSIIFMQSHHNIHTPSEKKGLKKQKKKDKNQLFETAVKQPPGGYELNQVRKGSSRL